MIDQLAYSAANHFGELETSFLLGRKRGKEEGLQQGLQQGLLDGQLKIAQQMLGKSFSDDLILELTGLSQEELDGLKARRLD
ncbi:transposase [Streptococcus suis]|uniref:transposase n=1 Tax=Streptococcus suis TaxID=1307 RepID=UPI000CF5E611|nr:transposase [Streptococcus suis]